VNAARAEELKCEAAERAVADEVRSGMAIGLGTGSTARYVTEAVGRLLADGTLRDVVAVPTSEATAALAGRVGVPLAGLDEQPALAVCIDGADEIAPGLALVKGLGGALLREKVVASAAARLCIVADGSKRVAHLGERAPLPVEVIGFAVPVCRIGLARLGCEPVLRLGADGTPFATDEGNRILDCGFGPIADPGALGAAIHAVPGVVEHGLFLGMADVAYVAGEAGVEILRA
jgi:ribose 5-phosphate isomerase A